MAALLVVLAVGSLLAVFWWVAARIRTDPAAPPRRKIAIQVDPDL
jgi:hypothetical protein